MNTSNSVLAAAILCASISTISVVQANELRVTIHNDAPAGGTFLTPLWVGFQDGSFNSFTTGTAASAGIKAIAEDGNPALISTLFAGHGVSGVVGAGPLAPGATATHQFTLAANGSNSLLSFAAMVLPSSDFFIGNETPLNIASVINGTLKSESFVINLVHDAGTEVNDFATSAGNGLFGIPGGQSGPAQGAHQNGVVANAFGTDYAQFLNVTGVNIAPLNFNKYQSLATITVESAPVPLPAAFWLLGSALGGLGFSRRSST